MVRQFLLAFLLTCPLCTASVSHAATEAFPLPSGDHWNHLTEIGFELTHAERMARGAYPVLLRIDVGPGADSGPAAHLVGRLIRPQWGIPSAVTDIAP